MVVVYVLVVYTPGHMHYYSGYIHHGEAISTYQFVNSAMFQSETIANEVNESLGYIFAVEEHAIHVN